MIVFSNNQWIEVFLPIGHDPCWMPADKNYYATIWAAAINIFDSKRAEVVAEAATAKRMYPELVYDSSLEADIKKVFD